MIPMNNDIHVGDYVRSRLVKSMVGRVKEVHADGTAIVNVDGTNLVVMLSNWVLA